MDWEESIMQKVCAHMLWYFIPSSRCILNEDSLPDNEDITLTSTMKSREERVTPKDAAPNSNTVAAAGLRGPASTHSSEMP